MPDLSLPPCPPWCSSEHHERQPSQVYVLHGGALTSFAYFHAVVSVSASWSELVAGQTLARPTVALGRLDADRDTFAHLSPEGAAALAEVLSSLKPEDLPRFARALAQAANVLLGAEQ